MDPERWNRLSNLLDELLELDPPVRARRLAEIVGVDAGLGDELQRMMALEDERPDFLAQSVVDAAVFAPQPGQSIGPYKLEAPIGEGGMGQVWLAIRDDGLYHRRVALKLLRPGLGDAGLRTRFTRERQILARLGHAHIARLLDAGVSSDGQPYLALDYVQGEAITDYARKLSLHPHDRLRLFLQVCAAVSHAHANLVVHRDLKPSNIMVTPAGEVCLLDFGIAKLLDESADGHDVITGTGTRAFTLHYAAPEQLRNGVITTMTDVYSLGVVLYELLVGRKPYDPARATDAAWEEAILTGDAVRPSVAAQRLARESGTPHPRRLASELAGDLDNILLKALAKAPEDRYVSVEAMAQDLRRHLGGKPVLARAQSLGYRTQKFVSRNSVGLIVAVSVAGLMVAALGFMYWQASMAIVEAQRAQAMQDFVVALFENTDQAGSGDGLDVRLLLDAGVRRADTELISQPQARAELMGLVVRLRQGLGDDRQALDLLDRQSQVLAALAGEAPARIGIESAALRGRSLRALGQPEVCVRALAPWMPVSEQQASEQPRTVSEFLSQLGRCHRQLGGLDVARDLFGKALAMRSGLADSKALQAESQTDLAGLLADEGRHAQAITAIRDALTLLRESGGDRNALGVEIWRDLGSLHRMVGDPLESEASYRQALEIALNRFGPSHPASTSVQRPLGAILIEAGKLTEAERLLRQAHERLLARFGPEHADVAASWQTLGQLALEQGQLTQAQDALQRSLQLRRRSNDLGARGSVLCDLARTRLALGQAESAELLGHECLQQALAFDPMLAARSERLLAEVARVQGNPQAAAALLASAKQRLLAAGIDPASRALAVIQLATVRLLVDGGDLAQARAALDTLQAQPRRRSIEWEDVAWRTDALEARLLCRQGKAGDGRERAAAALAAATARQPERQRTLNDIAEITSPCGRG